MPYFLQKIFRMTSLIVTLTIRDKGMAVLRISANPHKARVMESFVKILFFFWDGGLIMWPRLILNSWLKWSSCLLGRWDYRYEPHLTTMNIHSIPSLRHSPNFLLINVLYQIWSPPGRSMGHQRYLPTKWHISSSSQWSSSPQKGWKIWNILWEQGNQFKMLPH